MAFLITSEVTSPLRSKGGTSVQISLALLAFLFLFVLYPVRGDAQSLPGVEQGLKPYGAYDGGDIDSISMVNGSLTLHIPLISYPQRGGKLRVGFSLVYGNPFYTNTDNCVNQPPQCVPTHWYYHLSWGAPYHDPSGLPAVLNVVPDFYPGVRLHILNGLMDGWEVHEPDGAVHLMGATSTGQGISMDATGYSYSINASLGTYGTGILIDRHGTRYYYPYAYGGATQPNYPSQISKIEDINGNVLTPTYGTNSVLLSWTDTVGRIIPMPSNGSSTTNYTGCSGSLPTSGAYIWAPPEPNGGTSQFKSCTAAFPISYSPPDCGSSCTGISGSGGLQSIVLPNGTAWTFSFDTTGALTKIVRPAGGSISYAWNVNAPMVCLDQGDDFNYIASATSRSVDANDGTGGHKWKYVQTWTGSANQTVVTDPNLNDAVHLASVGGECSSYETELDQYAGSYTAGTLLKRTVTTYNSATDPLQTNLLVNVVPLTVTTTDLLSGKTSQIAKTYDTGIAVSGTNILYGNVMSEKDYDFGTGVPGSLMRTTTMQYLAFSNVNYLNNNLLDLVSSKSVFTGNSAAGACGANGSITCTNYAYDENAPGSSGVSEQHDAAPPGGAYRGNNTSSSHWLNTGTFTCPDGTSGGTGGYLLSKTTYFDTGMVNVASDPCSHSTTYLYSNTTYFGAFATTVTNALNQNTTNVYDLNTGQVTSTTDPNLLITSYSYDSMGRLSQVNHPNGGVDTITRQEATFPFSSTATTQINSTQSKVETTVFDGLGRVTQTQLTSDPQGIVYTDTAYDSLGRVETVSNPYRTGADPTSSPGTTTYTYDALSRKTKETYPDNSVLNTVYCGPSTLVTDPTGKWRRSRVNGLGQLVEVDEPNSTTATVASTGCPGTGEPIWITSYTNDVRGNLTNVVQNASRTRSFTYDSLSRLLTAQNPENGTITYTYNPDSTVLTKKDARLITANYAYDKLHRETGITYSNSDPSLTFTYDGSGCLNLTACQNIGHRTGMTDGAGSESWAYQTDPTNLRSIHEEQRVNNSTPHNITKETTYYLDLAGNVTQLTYPTGRGINYAYDSAGRPSKATGVGSGSVTYASDWQTPPTGCLANAVCYAPQGSIYAISIGQTSTFTGFNVSESYNNRLQPTEMKASSSAGSDLDITYNFVDPVSGKNAGHVYGIGNVLNSSRGQAFTYDQLNRIVTAGTSATTGSYCWGYQFAYDAWGNLNSQGPLTGYSACTQFNPPGSTADGNNHLPALSYDASGNTQNDGSYTYTWDGESQLTSAAGVTYAYDGDGRRAAKVGSKLYWYGSGGEILSETDASGTTLNEYVFFGGKRIADVSNGSGALYYAEDMLGSSRVVVKSNGTLCYDADFTPFGGERAYTATCSQNYKFEGKERDTETLNDDFGARYYSWRFGRWLSSDWSAVPVAVPYANLTNPQTLNLYSMVEDDPESFADLDGHEGFWSSVNNFALGLENAWSSDNLASIGRQEQNTTAGQAGAVVGDALATLQGVQEASVGATAVAGGVVACGTGVGCAAGAPAAAVGSVAVVHGATTAAEGAGHLLETAAKMLEGSGDKVDKVIDKIDKGGFDVKANPKTPGQEGNVTISHPNQPGSKVNVRVETHPLKPGGDSVRHANVERVEPGSKNRPVVVSNEHITE